LIEPIILLIGNLVLPYLVLSVFAMIFLELIAAVLNLRGKILQDCIHNMLCDSELAEKVYRHPLIASLSPRKHRPAYIPSRLFALSLVSVMQLHTGTIDFVRAISDIPNGQLREGLQALLRLSPPGEEICAIQKWYLEVMDQASALYRHSTTIILFIIATMMVVALNLDAIRISNYITQRGLIEKVFEARLIAVTKLDPKAPSDAAPLKEEIVASFQGLSFPIGWQKRDIVVLLHTPGALFLKIVGLMTSILAVLLGAPLLFDVLSKILNIRFSGKPNEDSLIKIN
jgi:hypothetical protein